MTTTNHRHTAHTTTTGPYFGAVAFGNRSNPAARGNVTEREVCECGASRLVNVNGNHVERTPWTKPEAE